MVKIITLVHNLSADYAQGKIIDREFDQGFDLIQELESEERISVLDVGEINYESKYQMAREKLKK